MIGPERRLPDRKRTRVERLRRSVVAPRVAEAGQIVHVRRDSRMVGAERLLVNRQRARIQRLRCIVVALGLVEKRQIV